MNISALYAKAARLERELREIRERIAQAEHDPKAVADDLARNRGYAFSAAALSVDEVVEGCADSLDRYGFCVIDNLIPNGVVDAIREEVKAARLKIDRNHQALQELLGGSLKTLKIGAKEEALLTDPAAADKVELRPARRVGHPPKLPNDIVWMPRYAQHLANPFVTGVARRVLDDHLRIAQLHLRIIDAAKPDGTPGGFGAAHRRGRPDTREWHTDWPHDMTAYGRGDPGRNIGCIRQPFPDVAMCLVLIWYLTDVDEDSGGTWVVPGSHKDTRNPRGASDGITCTAPIPGDMQITAAAGSVYIQDSRSWHASPLHNTSGRERIAVVNRWCPWWFAVDDYAPHGINNTVCQPLSHSEYLALPTELQPLMRHLCPEEQDTVQQPLLDRAVEADVWTRRAFKQLEEDPDSLLQANAHIRVPVAPSRRRD